MRWPWRRRKDPNGLAERVRQAKQELAEERARGKEVRSLAAQLRAHLADNQFAERLYMQMIETRR